MHFLHCCNKLGYYKLLTKGGKRLFTFIISAIKIIFLLGFLILIHEAGHFFVAKWCGVKVNEFAIGFGPTIWKKQGKETKYALRLVPLGGFVSMEGEEERSEDSRSFSKASIPKRVAICMAGATVNIIFGVIVFFILMASSGTYISNVIGSMVEGYPAMAAGIQADDKIVEVDEKEVRSYYDLNEILEETRGKEVNVKVQRNDEILEYKVKPIEENDSYYLGVNLIAAPDTFMNRLVNGAMQTKEFLFSIIDNLKQLFTGNVSVDQMMGPVGISETVAKTSGIKEFVYMLALISLSLGVTNLLPIPALDGGKILILLIEAVRRKPMKEQTEINIQLLGFSILIILSLYVTYNDIVRIF